MSEGVDVLVTAGAAAVWLLRGAWRRLQAHARRVGPWRMAVEAAAAYMALAVLTSL